MSNKILIHGSLKQLDLVAPGMVVLDLCKHSKYPWQIWAHSSDRHYRNVVTFNQVKIPNILLLLIKSLTYRMNKYFFCTSNQDTILYYVSIALACRREKIAIAVVHVSFSLCWVIKWISPKTEIVYYHHGGNLHVRLNPKLWKRLRKACSLMISVSEAAVYGCISKFKEETFRMKVINNAVNVDVFKVNRQISKRELFGIDDPFVFCFAGRVNYEKGLDKALNVIQKLHSIYPNSRLLIIGESDVYDKATINMIDKIKKFNNFIYLTGYIPKFEVANYQSLANVGLLLSQKSEGNSLFAIESLYLGIPLIVTNKGGNNEINTEKYKPSIIIEVDDVQEDTLLNAMELLLTNKEIYCRMSQDAKLRSQHFKIGRMINEFDNEIESMFSI